MSNLEENSNDRFEQLCINCDTSNRSRANYCRACGHLLKVINEDLVFAVKTSNKSETAHAPDRVNSDEIFHLKKMEETYLKRLRILEQKAAREGYNVAPETLTEIDDIRTSAENITKKLNLHNESNEYKSETVNLQFDINHDHKIITAPLQNIVRLRVALTLSVRPNTIEIIEVTSSKISMRVAAPMSSMLNYFDPENEKSSNKSTIVRNIDINHIQLVNIRNSFVMIRRNNDEIKLFDMRKSKLLFENYNYQDHDSILINNEYFPFITIRSINISNQKEYAALRIRFINDLTTDKLIAPNTHVFVSPRKANSVHRLFALQVYDIDYLEFYWSERALQIGRSSII